MHAMRAETGVSQQVKVRLSAVSKRFGTRHGELVAVDGISLEIPDGQFVAIVGPSGCGKSTLLRLVAGLYAPSEGSVEVRQSTEARPPTAMVFQDHALFPWLTVRANVMFGPRNRGVPKRAAAELADAQLERMGLAGFAEYFPHQLSGGMKQRVGIARALAQNPEILLMDEPLGALDAQTRTLLQEQILELRKETRPTAIYVTHAIDEAIFLADRVILLTARPGRLKEDIAVELPEGGPEVRGTAEFARLSQEIWNHLRAEVEAAMAGDAEP